MTNLQVEDLKNMRNFLNQSCFQYNVINSGQKETLYDVVGKIDTEGAVDYMDQLFKNFEKYCGTEGIGSDVMSVSMTFGAFLKGDLQDKDPEYIISIQAEPVVGDLVVVDTGVGSFQTDSGDQTVDPTKYADEEFKSFIVSFSEFKRLLSEKGYNFNGVQTFDDIAKGLLESKFEAPRATISYVYNKVNGETR